MTMPIRLLPVLWVIAASLGLGALFWLADAVGDVREAKVWREINAAIAETNDDIGAQNALADRVKAVADKARSRALDEAKQVKGGVCLLSADEALALSRIR